MKLFRKANRYELNGDKRRCPQGFSFTALLFGFLTPLLARRDLKGAVTYMGVMFPILVILAPLCAYVAGPSGYAPLPLLWHLIFAATYNKRYESDTKVKGYQIVKGGN